MRRARRVLLAALEVDQAPVEPVADRPPHVLLDQPRRRIVDGHALVDVARRLRDAGDDQRRERLGLLRGRLRVADPHLDRAEAKCGRTDHHTWVNSTIELVRTRNSMYSR